MMDRPASSRHIHVQVGRNDYDCSRCRQISHFLQDLYIAPTLASFLDEVGVVSGAKLGREARGWQREHAHNLDNVPLINVMLKLLVHFPRLTRVPVSKMTCTLTLTLVNGSSQCIVFNWVDL